MKHIFRINGDVWFVCPYNSSHLTSPRRYDIHIGKCAIRSKLRLATCPFYYTHRVPPEQMEKHLEYCPAARRAIWSQYEFNRVVSKTSWGPRRPSELVPAPPRKFTPEQDEADREWNKEKWPFFCAPGLDGSKPPLDPTRLPNILQYQNLSKAERKEFQLKMSVLRDQMAMEEEKRKKYEAERKEIEIRVKEELKAEGWTGGWDEGWKAEKDGTFSEETADAQADNDSPVIFDVGPPEELKSKGMLCKMRGRKKKTARSLNCK